MLTLVTASCYFSPGFVRVGKKREEDMIFNSLGVERKKFCHSVKVGHFMEDSVACLHRQDWLGDHANGEASTLPPIPRWDYIPAVTKVV